MKRMKSLKNCGTKRTRLRVSYISCCRKRLRDTEVVVVLRPLPLRNFQLWKGSGTAMKTVRIVTVGSANQVVSLVQLDLVRRRSDQKAHRITFWSVPQSINESSPCRKCIVSIEGTDISGETLYVLPTAIHVTNVHEP
jgi:hypothetical protein